jgi:dihydropteroate synthase
MIAPRDCAASDPPRGAEAEGAGSGFAAMLRSWRDAGPGKAPIIMGIVNVTPDSFSDGGAFADADRAIRQGLRLVAEGADILDIGGESTRKGATPVAAREEMRRVLPVIEGLAGAGVPLSIDTMKAEVAEAAIGAGATIVNDVRGLQGDAAMAAVAARFGAGVVAMHNPAILGSAIPLPGDPIAACRRYFERSLAIAAAAGIGRDRLVLDPGFGFGKSPEQNLEILRRLPELAALGQPLMVGTSRKAFVGKVTGRDNPDRLVGTLATNIVAALNGAAIIRVHDVAAHAEAMRMVAAIDGAGRGGPQ